MRYIVESLSGYSTLGDRDGFGSENTSLWIDTPIRLAVRIPRVKRTAILVKRHRMREHDARSATLFFLVRDPRRAIVSHMHQALHRPAAVQKKIDAFVELCRVVDSWPARVVPLFYEDFVSEDADTFRTAVTTLMQELDVVGFEPALERFIRHRDEHVQRAFLSLERESVSASIDWESKPVRAVENRIGQSLRAVASQSPIARSVMKRYIRSTDLPSDELNVIIDTAPPAERIDLDEIIREGAELPPGVELFWQNEAEPEVGTAASDFDYFQGRWIDVRSTPDVSMLTKEALYRFTNVEVNSKGGLRLADGSTIHSRWLGSLANSWTSIEQIRHVGEIDDPAFSIAFRAEGFGHWYLHRLSRLATVHRQAPGRRAVTTAMKWSPSFIWEAFGVDVNAAFPLRERMSATASDLLVPTYATPLNYPRVTDTERMRRDVADFTRGIGGRRGDGFGPEKIFLGRFAASTLRDGVADPVRLTETFERRGFVNVDIAALPFVDQIRLVRSARVIAGEVGSFSLNGFFAEPGLGVITVAARNLWGKRWYQPGDKTFTRTVTDTFEHHQRRIVASETKRAPFWEIDFDLLEDALDTMPEIP